MAQGQLSSLSAPTARIVGLVAMALAGLCSLAAPAWAANEVFDARGFTPNRDYFSQLPYEHIDPLTGNLLLTFTDLVLPGNAGFDLRIQRTYNSKIFADYQSGGDAPDEDSWAGLGWTLHLGRVLQTPAGIPASVELPDGSRHKLFHHINATSFPCSPPSGCYITRDFWVYVQSATPLLLSPDGIKYTLGYLTTVTSGGVATPVRYPTRIEDSFGNFFTIVYMTTPEDGIQSITQDLGGGEVRTVTFTVTGTRKTLNTMSYTGATTHTWTYTQVDANSVPYSLLTEVRPPVGPRWRYQYNTTGAPVSPCTGPTVRNELIGVTTPNGGQIDYVYCDKAFRLGGATLFNTRAVIKRTTGGRGVTAGSWTYAYAPDLGGAENQSRITSPSSCGTITTTYTFMGVGNYSNQVPVWKIGLLQTRVVADGGGSLETESLVWAPSALISSDIETSPGGFNQSAGIPVPLLSTRTLTRGGQNYVTTNTYSTNASNFNDYGRPFQIDENGDLTGTRRTTRVFQYGFTPYLVDRIASETVSLGSESFAKSYSYTSSNGFKTSQTIYGITTTFTPTTSRGNVASSTNNGNTTAYSYDWGLASTITTPMYPITRVVNPEGTIASETRQYWNGSSNQNTTTTFAYDLALRPTEKDPQVGNTIVTAYDNTGGTSIQVTRGPSQTTTNLDGLGRSVGTSNSVGIQTRIDYDACGRKSYESYPQTGAPDADHGNSYQYDALDRITRKTNKADNPDTFVQYAYGPGLQVTVTDENNHVTTQAWKAFGSPTEARLTSLTEANNRQTSYTYNVLGSLTKVTHPGSLMRTWAYFNTTGLLQQETHPESGSVSYTYDAAGNVQTRTDFRGQTTYGYDGNNRLTGITRPTGFAAYNTTFQYDGSDRRKLAQNSSYVTSNFAYDGANRLVTRTDIVSGRNFTTGYASYDGNDNVLQINYPSARQVTYAYDSENRISSVGKPGAANFFAASFVYHPSGAVGSFQPGGGNALQQFTYDDRYRPQVVNTGTQRLNLTYSYDPVGNVTGISDTRPSMSQVFTYDAVDRLFTGTGSWGSGSFAYDDLGNRTSTSVGGSVTFTYSGANNRLTSSSSGGSFGYDSYGNVTSDGAFTYAYTPENLVETAAGATYRYDGDNLRKLKVAGDTRYYLHGPGNQILSEFVDSCGNLLSVRDYVYAGSRLLASVRPTTPVISVSVGATTVAESAGPVPVTITLSTPDGNPTTSPVTVNYATANGTATAGSDYTGISGIDTFPIGTASGTSHVISGLSIINDTEVESDQTFSINLTGGCGAILGTAIQTITILDDDATVAFVAASSSVSEGAGTAQVDVKITTSHGGNTTNQVTVQYQTANGTALAGSDFTTTSGTMTFAQGTPSGTVQTISVPILNDAANECSETLSVGLSSPTGGLLGSPASHQVTISDDDFPSVSVGDALPVTEGNSGTVNGVFTVTVGSHCQTVTVGYQTSNGSALAGSDYQATSGVLSFPSGTSSLPVSVPLIGETLDEDNEWFFLDLTNPTNAVLGISQGQGTILDDDGRAAVCIPIVKVPYTISSQGAYCLVQNLSTGVTSGNAITIESDSVVLDLKGFKIGGGAAGFGTQANGVYASGRKSIVIRNGHIRGFYRGIFLTDGPPYTISQGHLIERVRADSNTFAGIWVNGRGVTIRGNQVANTTGTTANGSSSDCLGIVTFGSGARIIANDVTDTTGVGASGTGFAVQVNDGTGTVVSGNRVGDAILGESRGIAVRSNSSSVLVVNNRIARTSYGIWYDATSGGKYQGNLTSGVPTPFTGGTDGGNNN